MFVRGVITAFALLTVLFGTVVPSASAGNLYRYTDANGNPVIVRSIPPEAVDNGYEVLTESMRVIKVVPPALKGEALKKKLAEEQRQQRLEQLDEFLLLNYNTPEEIVEARERKVSQLALFVDTKQNAIERVEDDLAAALRAAATQERMGKEVSQQMLENIETLKLRIVDEKKQLEAMRQDLVDVRMEYADMIERMYYLLGLRPPEEGAEQADPEAPDAETAGSQRGSTE